MPRLPFNLRADALEGLRDVLSGRLQVNWCDTSAEFLADAHAMRDELARVQESPEEAQAGAWAYGRDLALAYRSRHDGSR